jgi:hypothetical protein
MSLPILPQPDPKVSGEGALDPIGVATISDRLAERVLPGLRARMARPRFLTAMAVSAVVCEGMEDRVAADGTTPPYIVFEWLVVEAFARAARREDTVYTPGMLKAQAVVGSKEPMRRDAYLRIPTIFGFHGIYRPLARQAGVVDEDMRLGDAGYSLLRAWEAEQGVAGFLPTASGDGPGTQLKATLRSAVEDSLRKGCSDRSAPWKGWQLIAERLAPARVGVREASALHGLLLHPDAEPRGEVCELIRAQALPDDMTEADLVTTVLLSKAKPELRRRLQAVADFEAACGLIEEALDWVRHLSSRAGARALTPDDFSAEQRPRAIAQALGDALRAAETSIAALDDSLEMQQDMAGLARGFDHVAKAGDLFEAVLSRHHEVQQRKLPDGKRDWFERNPDGATFVRVPYRLPKPPLPMNEWNRPYRFNTLRSFLRDLKAGVYEPA